MKYFDLSSKNRPSPHWTKVAAASLLAAALAGCGGSTGPAGPAGADGAAGAPGTPGAPGANLVATVNVGSNATAASAAATAAWQALQPQVTVTSVTINSAPVVKFTVKDAAGNPVVGLANYSQPSTATVKGLVNVAFTLAKLVPATTYTVTAGGVTTTYNSDPSKWVSYNVYKTPTVAQKAAAPTVPWYGTWPSTDAQGTLVDNGDGSYQYTFMRDPKQAAAIVAALPDVLPLSDKKDLGDVSYDATLTHRLGIQIGGAAPGTGSNLVNPTTLAPVSGAPAGVNMVNTANAVYDFRPDGAPVANTRDIVSIDTCGSCHDKKVLAHGSRKDPRYCVTCHTDQVKYSINAEATPVGAMVLTGTTNFTTSVVNGKTLADFPNMIHKVHMGNRLVKQGYNFIPGSSGVGLQFNTLAIPQDIRNCTTCHDGAATVASKKTTNGDNWKSSPSVLACGSCHDGINFATGAGSTIADKLKDVAAKVAIGTTRSGHLVEANNQPCALCHTAEKIALKHTGSLPANSDATKRTMSAAISKAAVAADGSVTVNFTISDNGVAVTDPAAISGLAFSLAKLNPSLNGASTHWQSYTGKARTTVATNPPVVQGYSETALAANLTVDATTKVWTYKFQLLTASTPGDIRTVDHVHNGTTLTTGAYTPALVPTLPYVVTYQPALTHRIGMEFNKAATTTPVAAAVANKFNAIYDWVPVPDPLVKAQTRNIVSMDSCATCHAGSKIHKGFTTEYCVTCHNQNTYDPSTGTGNGVGTAVVDLQVIVHKLHMGNQLPSVKAGGKYTINGAGHDYSGVAFPGVISDCAVCHKATATKADGKTLLENAAAWYTTPTKRACSTCHDSAIAVAHIDSNVVGGVETCVTCHNPGKVSDVKFAHGN